MNKLFTSSKALLLTIFSSGLLVLVGAFAVKRAYADDLCPDDGQFSNLCNLTAGDLGSVIGNFISFLFLIAVIAALLYLIWGGLKWLTSAGDKTALQGAREHLVAAIIGLIIIFMSYLILNFVIRFFIPGFNLSSFEIPTIDGSSSSSGNTNANCNGRRCDTAAGFYCIGGQCKRVP